MLVKELNNLVGSRSKSPRSPRSRADSASRKEKLSIPKVPWMKLPDSVREDVKDREDQVGVLGL